jgi:uncharacterized FlgJ-related protein
MKKYTYDPEKLTFEEKKTNTALIIVIISAFLFIAIGYYKVVKSKNEEEKYEKEINVIVEKILHMDSMEFSFPEFKQYVLDLQLKFPDIVIAQAIQESSFKSQIWKENNNPFGLKVAKSRNTTAIGVNRGHAVYKDWKMAVIDYSYLQAVYARKIKTREGYYQFLNSYAEDEGYQQKLKNIIRKHKGFGISEDYLNDF